MLLRKHWRFLFISLTTGSLILSHRLAQNESTRHARRSYTTTLLIKVGLQQSKKNPQISSAGWGSGRPGVRSSGEWPWLHCSGFYRSQSERFCKVPAKAASSCSRGFPTRPSSAAELVSSKKLRKIPQAHRGHAESSWNLRVQLRVRARPTTPSPLSSQSLRSLQDGSVNEGVTDPQDPWTERPGFHELSSAL